MADAIWITGVGASTPLGNDFDSFSDNVLNGRSGIRTVPPETHGGSPVQFAGMSSIPLPRGAEAGNIPNWNRLEQLLHWCIVSALRDSGWWENRQTVRVGICLGMGSEWPNVWQLDWLGQGQKVFQPETDDASIVHRAHRRLGLRGPATTVAAACASANHALAQARRWLKLGWADVCLAGGGDVLTPMAFSGFSNLRALSRRNDDPTAASRPFDTDRDGFVLGEGAVVFALERSSSARRRGARVYAEFSGFGATSDASHMIIPSSDPEFAIKAVQQSLTDAQINPSDVHYVNAHATSTPVGDRAESKALRMVFGESASRVPVSSTKSVTGHLLSGASAIEAMACLAAIEHQAIPPTMNLVHPDPECDLLHVPNQARPQPVRVALSNSFGFGGSNTCAVFRKAA